MSRLTLATALSAALLTGAVSAAQAGPILETQRDVVTLRQHDYWLSSGLSRLAFWQTRQKRTDDLRQH